MTQAIRLSVSRTPHYQLRAIWLKHIDADPKSVPTDSLTVVDRITDLIDSGLITLDEVKGAAPAVTTGVDVKTLDSIKAVVNKANDNAIEALSRTGSIAGALQGQATSLAKLDDKIETLSIALNKVAAVDPGVVNDVVAKTVADAFAPFKQAVIAAGAEQVIADLSAVKPVARKPALDVFGVDVINAKGDPVLVDIWDAPDAPAIDPNFIWTKGILRHLLLAQNTGENLWFGGEKGTGKSETARQFAAYTGRSFKRINFHKYTTCEDYVGAVGLENGATVFKKGDFLKAFTSPSTVILLDEVTNTDAGELATLNGFLEPNSAVNYGGATHRRAAGVLVFAADNTLGNGDESQRYAGTRVMNSALVDRFARVIKFDYLDPSDEVAAIIKHTGCHQALATHVVKAIRAARAKVETADIVDAPSIRQALAFIRALEILPVDEAWATTIASRQPSESAPAIEAIKQAYINSGDIASWL